MRAVLSKFFTLYCLTVTLSSCGGGSAGTGTGGREASSIALRSIEGVVTNQASDGLPGVTIRLPQANLETITDRAGYFAIQAPVQQEQVILEVEAAQATENVILNDLPDDQSTVNLQIQLDQQAHISSVSKLKVNVEIIDDCLRYFENGRTILQVAEIANKTHCRLQASVVADSQPYSGATFLLQHRDCAGKKRWRDVAVGETGTNGIGEISFRFRTDEAHCVYRVIVPHNIDKKQRVFYQIHSLMKQAFDAKTELP